VGEWKIWKWPPPSRKLTLAGQVVKNIEFIVAGSEVATSAVGVIGQNVLGMADADTTSPRALSG